MLQKHSVAAAFAATLALAGAARAADDPQDGVVVTASPFDGHTDLEMAQPATVLHGDRLRRRQAGNLGDALSTEPGVQSSSFGPGSGRPIIRGQDGARVRVMDGGLGTLDVSTVSPDHQVTGEPAKIGRAHV